MEAAVKQEIKTRMYKPEDYKMLTEWWTKQKWPSVPEDMLPDVGMISECNGEAICAGFLYLSNSKAVWMEFIIANPDTDKTIRDAALDELVDNLCLYAELKNNKYIVTCTPHPKLVERLNKKGFITGHTGMTEMVRVLNRR